MGVNGFMERLPLPMVINTETGEWEQAVQLGGPLMERFHGLAGRVLALENEVSNLEGFRYDVSQTGIDFRDMIVNRVRFSLGVNLLRRLELVERALGTRSESEYDAMCEMTNRPWGWGYAHSDSELFDFVERRLPAARSEGWAFSTAQLSGSEHPDWERMDSARAAFNEWAQSPRGVVDAQRPTG